MSAETLFPRFQWTPGRPNCHLPPQQKKSSMLCCYQHGLVVFGILQLWSCSVTILCCCNGFTNNCSQSSKSSISFSSHSLLILLQWNSCLSGYVPFSFLSAWQMKQSVKADAPDGEFYISARHNWLVHQGKIDCCLHCSPTVLSSLFPPPILFVLFFSLSDISHRVPGPPG